jgi:hypothetical protein
MAMTTKELLTWGEQKPAADVFAKIPDEYQGTTWLVGEDSSMCCRPWYFIGEVNGNFHLDARYARPGDPVRDDPVFATLAEAKAAAEAAYYRLIQTKFWDNIATYECYIINQLERAHRPGCPGAAKAAALFGCPEHEPPHQWLIANGFMTQRSDGGFAFTTKAEAVRMMPDPPVASASLPFDPEQIF